MSRYSIKFPFRVRIHGGEFDESARAIHREDGLKTIQAESGIVLESTIERKQMSTKTTFKRIALVTVAALGFGVMSVAPSSAALAGAPLGVTQTLSASTTTVVAGTAAKTVLTTAGYFAVGDSVTSSVALTNYSAGVTAAGVTAALSPVFSAIDTGVATTNGDGTVSAGGSSQVASTTTLEVGAAGSATRLVSTTTQLAITLSVPGTYTYTITNTNRASSPSLTDGSITKLTWTVVVTAPVLSSSTVFITTATAAGTAATADSTTLTGSATASATPVARIDVSQYMTATALLTDGYTKAVVVSVSGAGQIGATAGDAARGISLTQAAGTTTAVVNGYSDWFLHADGRSGTSTITVTVDGVLVATKTFKFFGALASYSVVASKKNIGVAETGTLTVTGKDANLNDATLGTVTAVSSDVAIATVAVVGGVVTVTGVKAGTATITLSNAATAATVTKTETVTILPVTAPKLAWAFDKDTYEAGEKMTLTITAAGVADGARAVFTANPTSNFSLANGSDTVLGSPVFAAGVATYTLYAPANPGKFTLTATVGSAIDTEAVIIAAAGTRTVATLSATVTNPALTAAQEATDAANEATDAGNNAKDAADQAIEAADAATIAAQDAAAAAELAGEVAVAAAEAAGEIAQEALDAANAATDAALSAAEAADAATAAATEAKESADAATAAVAALSAEVAKLMADLNLRITKLGNTLATILKKLTK
jgi:hypothetical protein